MNSPDLTSHASILNWLHGISETFEEASPISQSASPLRTTHRKRKYCPPSPPLSVCMNASSIAKRARGAGDQDDDLVELADAEVTPKAARIARRHSAASSRHSSRSNDASSATESSGRSGRSRLSHKQHLNSRTYSSDSMIVKELASNELDVPQSLRVLWRHVGRLGRGAGVIGQSQEVCQSPLQSHVRFS